MTPTPWHLDDDLLNRYADGQLQIGVQASVETHLQSCAICQRSAASVVGPQQLIPVWQGILAEIDAPELSIGLRVLTRLGLSDADAVVVRGSTQGLYRPWVASVGGALTFALLAGCLADRFQLAAVLLIAPLVPVLAVLVAYDGTDPLRAVASTTPLSQLRIMLLRTIAAAGTAVPLTLAVTLVVPGLGKFAELWLLPALLLMVVALTLLSWCSARVTGALVAGAWVVFVLGLRTAGSLEASRNAGTQLLFLGAAAIAAALLVARTRAARPSRGLA
jgi:hypothetical protein